MTDNDTRRYIRLSSLPEIGIDGVAVLSKARVLIIGCGALGSLCAMYLAASGVGSITIADFDTIDLSNLQRQLFFTEDSLGQSKARTLEQRMRAINSTVDVIVVEKMLRYDDALGIAKECDVIIDGSDNPETKLMTDRIGAVTGKPCIIAGVKEFICQIMTIGTETVRYSQIFGSSPESNGFTPCRIAGVLGPAAGVAASLQAAEAIKLITGAGEPLYNRLLNFNLLDMSVNVIPITMN